MIAGKRILWVVFAVILSCSLIGIEYAKAEDPVKKSVRGIVTQIIHDDDTLILEVKSRKRSKRSKWAAVPNMEVAVGDQVSLQPGVVLYDYYLKGVGRTFDQIIFSPGP